MSRKDQATVAVDGVGISFDPKLFNGGNESVANYTSIKVLFTLLVNCQLCLKFLLCCYTS